MKTRANIWTFYLVGVALFGGALYAGLLSLPTLSIAERVGLFVYTLGASVIVSKNLVDIYIGAGSIKQNLQDIFVTMLGFSLMFGAGVVVAKFFF